MASIIRGSERLARFSDKQLAQLVASCICLGIDGEQLADYEASWQAGGRKMVIKAACAYDLLVHKNTKRIAFEPSDESKAWSSMEGGHIFFERPTYDISALITGHLWPIGSKVSEAL